MCPDIRYKWYKNTLPEEKRDLLKVLTSNRYVEGKNVVVKLNLPFNEVANRFQDENGAPQWDIPRTWDRLFEKLVEYFKNNPGPVFEMVGTRTKLDFVHL